MNITQTLDVYKYAHELTLEIYKITSIFPREELFGLSSQMKRAAVSINSNLMEGGARRHSAEYARFILYARGSVAELTYQIIVANDLNFINSEQYDNLNDRLQIIGKMLSSLLNRISPQSPVPNPKGAK